MSASRQMFDRLAALTAALGLQLEQVQKAETSIDLNIETSVLAAAVSTLSCKSLNEVISDWGSDFDLQISSAAGIRPLTVSSSQPCSPSELSEFLGDVAASPSATLELRLRIQKQHFVDDRCSGPGKHILFIFTRNLKRALQGKPNELQGIFFPEGYFQCHCVLLEESVAVSGRHIFIHHDLTATPSFAAIPARHVQHHIQRINDIQQLRSDNTRWIDVDTYLTPMHFTVEQGADDASGLGLLISRLQYMLIIFYLAESVRKVTAGYLATFPGLTRIELLVPKEHPIKPVDNSLLHRMFRWCYSERTTDKLDIARGTISSVLGDDKSQNYELLSKHAERIWNASRSTYMTLVHDLVAKHFEKLKQVQDYITSISADVGGKVSSIVSSLTTNTLAAIGVVLGAFVAYAFDSNNKIHPDVFKFGLFVYGIYIFAFPFLYSLLLNNLTDYLILKKDFKRRLATFQAVLGIPGLYEKAASVVEARSRHFWAVFVFSAAIYLSLASVCFILWKYLVLP